jgi:hypothetical protein
VRINKGVEETKPFYTHEHDQTMVHSGYATMIPIPNQQTNMDKLQTTHK